MNVEGSLTDVDQFERIIVKSAPGNGGQITRIRDVGRVELGARTYGQFFKLDDKPVGGIQIFQLPGANALDTAERVRAAMEELSQGFSAGPQLLRFRLTPPTLSGNRSTKFITRFTKPACWFCSSL